MKNSTQVEASQRIMYKDVKRPGKTFLENNGYTASSIR
jgi:hypothetical protein